LHARKLHSSRRDAFKSVNASPIARVKDGKVEIIDEQRLAEWKTASKMKPEVVSFDEHVKIGWWKSHPQSYAEELVAFESFDGLMIEGSGLGHAPITQIDEFTAENTAIREQLAKLAGKIPVVMTTQTIYGRVNMDVYSPGRTLQEMGVLGHGLDMPAEIAFIKLAWLLSQDKKAVRSKFSHNFRGEISNKTDFLE
jgi:glutamyl-tRNA(Gln) amidotransferase subunit D